MLQLTHLPFVFARWMIRKSVPAADKQHLADDIAHSLSIIPIIPHIHPSGLTDKQAREYLSRIIFRLDAQCLQGIELFRKEMRALL